MTHVYQFNLWPPILGFGLEQNGLRTEIIVSYTAENILDNASLQMVARTLISQLISDWLAGDESDLNSYVSITVLSNILRADNKPLLADWVNGFNDLAVHNLDERVGACIWIIFS